MKLRAFTLVELLTVIAIISVLAGIAFPVFGAVRQRAQHTDCAERLHQLGTATVLYANDHDGWVPPGTTDEVAYLGTGRYAVADVKGSPVVLREAIRPYVKSEEVWFCPADPQRGRDVLWLSQRHRLTSYRFFPITEGQMKLWPPRMQLGRDRLSTNVDKAEDIPLWSDAMGLPTHDSEPPYNAEDRGTSNHPDNMVNAIRHDLSLSRRPASYWVGTKE